ncbi:hypothetical protein BJX64DRAFT_259963 [Aspergillus heterothallicus]
MPEEPPCRILRRERYLVRCRASGRMKKLRLSYLAVKGCGPLAAEWRSLCVRISLVGTTVTIHWTRSVLSEFCTMGRCERKQIIEWTRRSKVPGGVHRCIGSRHPERRSLSNGGEFSRGLDIIGGP